MKRCHVPREALPKNFKGSRRIEVGMSDPDDIFDRVYSLADTRYIISSGAIAGELGVRYYHISTTPCCNSTGGKTEKFLETPCYCVKIVDGIVVEITKHLPFRSKQHEGDPLWQPRGL